MSEKKTRKPPLGLKPSGPVELYAKTMGLVPRKPIVDPATGAVTWKTGKVWPGDIFYWQGSGKTGFDYPPSPPVPQPRPPPQCRPAAWVVQAPPLSPLDP